MSFAIRETTKADAYDTASVHVRSWQSAYHGIIPDDYLNSLNIKETAVMFESDFIKYQGQSFYYVAEHDGRVIGNLVMFGSRDEDKPDAVEIGAIYLLEEFWDKGYGRKMMDFALETLKNKGYREIILWVLEDNNRAKCFYEKHGFTCDGAKKEIDIGKPLVEIRYTKII